MLGINGQFRKIIHQDNLEAFKAKVDESSKENLKNVTWSGHNMFYRLAEAGRWDWAEYMLDKGAANANASDAFAKTYAIHLAAARGKIVFIHKLINHGVIINQQDSEENTALMHAARNNQRETALFLATNGADANLQNTQGQTVYDLSQENGEIEDEKFKIHLFNGLDGYERKKTAKTAIADITDLPTDVAGIITKSMSRRGSSQIRSHTPAPGGFAEKVIKKRKAPTPPLRRSKRLNGWVRDEETGRLARKSKTTYKSEKTL